MLVACVQELAKSEASELFVWLKGMASDADFQAAQEMALGRSELEVPPELWVVGGDGIGGEGSGGRADEEKLSMLAAVRTRFHKLLYRDDGGDETKYGWSILEI